MNTNEILEVVRQADAVRKADAKLRTKIDDYLRGRHAKPYTPPEANREYKLLADRSRTNWMPLVVSSLAQLMYVDGYRSRGADTDASPWSIWQANGLAARQVAVHRATIEQGLAYTITLPGDVAPVIRGASARDTIALYADPIDDVWPVATVRFRKAGDTWTVRVLDDQNLYTLTGSEIDRLKLERPEEHGVGVCPVVRFTNGIDLEGRAVGEVEPLFDLQDRINQTAFDLLMTQTFASFKVRTVAGMVLSEDDDTARAEKLRVSQDRFLVAEDPDTKFGELGESPLGGFIESLDQAVRHLAALSQTPPHHLLGQVANLSAEALAAAEASLARKGDELKLSLGESWKQNLRLAAAIAGDQEAADDVTAEIVWRDTGSRSFAATVDALGKAAQMLEIPAEALWPKIPGVSTTEVESWKALRGDAFSELEAELERRIVEVE